MSIWLHHNIEKRNLGPIQATFQRVSMIDSLKKLWNLENWNIHSKNKNIKISIFFHLYMFQEDNLDKTNRTKWNVSYHKFHGSQFDNNIIQNLFFPSYYEIDTNVIHLFVLIEYQSHVHYLNLLMLFKHKCCMSIRIVYTWKSCTQKCMIIVFK